VLAIHDRLLALHGAHRLRDRTFWSQSLRVAPAPFPMPRLRTLSKWLICIQLALSAIILSVDGNKRTGFVIGVLFLELHGFDFKASEADATQAVMALASGRLDEAAFTACCGRARNLTGPLTGGVIRLREPVTA